GARCIATNRDGTYPREEGREIPGGGAMVAALEACAGPAEVTIGKPEPTTWREILALTGVSPRDAVMVGDRAETDILGARQVGMITILVLTGVTQEEELPHLPAEQRPDFILPAVANLPRFVAAQIDAVARDLQPAAVKTGALGRAQVVSAVAARIERRRLSNLVIDPIILAKDGTALLTPRGVEALKRLLLPLGRVITPN